MSRRNERRLGIQLSLVEGGLAKVDTEAKKVAKELEICKQSLERVEKDLADLQQAHADMLGVLKVIIKDNNGVQRQEQIR